jgi:hypothetical protein
MTGMNGVNTVAGGPDDWRHWLALNANNLIWTALIVGMLVFTSLLSPAPVPGIR